MEAALSQLVENWRRKNIAGIYCQNKKEAADKILESIPRQASVGASGSMTLDALGVIKALEERGSRVFNAYRPGLSREESLQMRILGTQADYYLASPNAISQRGELVFFSAYPNRILGVSGARNVIIVSGVNKVTPDLGSALRRAREYATPLNCKRLQFNTPCLSDGICRNDECTFPEYKRMCCQVLIIEAELAPGRIRVFMVGEDLGF